LKEGKVKKAILFIFLISIFSATVLAQGDFNKVTYSYGTSALFVGIMAALWATRTGRSGLLWFFFGWFLAPIACLVAWLKNMDDKKKT
jgi:O-antigen/teichoic acid export membrane protein